MGVNSIIIFFIHFFTKNEIVSRFSCPHTSYQNGKFERKIRSINNIIRTLICHASLPSNFWPHALNTATYLHNILPSKLLGNPLPNIFSITKLHLILIFSFLDVYAFLLYPPLKLINLNLVLLLAFLGLSIVSSGLQTL